MVSPSKSWRLYAALGLALFPCVAASQTKTRLMILMDNSNSMHETVNGLDSPNPDGSYDLDPAWMSDGGATLDGGQLLTCNLAALQDAGLCLSKFCSAKCVLYNAMDSYEEDFEFGFATYNTYRRRVGFSLGSTTCQYDVLAGPGENLPGGSANRFWSVRSNLAPSCAITRSTAVGGVRQDTSLSGSRFICDNNPGTAGLDPAKSCSSVVTTAADWYTNNGYTGFDLFRNDGTTPGGAAAGATVAGTKSTCGDAGASFTCSTVNNAAIFPGAGGANEPNQAPYNSLTYYLRTVQDYPSTVGNLNQYTSTPGGGQCIDATDALGSQTAALATGPTTGGLSSNLSSLVSSVGCSASRPCVWTLINRQSVAVADTINNATCNANTPPTVGNPPNAWLANGTSTTTTTSGTYYSAPSCPATTLSCPSQTASCGSAPATCSVPAGAATGLAAQTYSQVSYDQNPVSPPAGGYTIGAASTAATWTDTSVQVTNVSQCAATRLFTGTSPNGQNCGASFTGRCEYHTPVYVPIAGDSTKGNCQWRLSVRSFTRPVWTCTYTFTQYRFRQTIPNPPVVQCSWHLRRYTWRPQLYRYDWTTAGGEMVSSVSVTLDPVNRVCNTSPVAFPSPPPTAGCPAKLDAANASAPAACKLAGRECRLRWWSKPGAGSPALYTSYNFGRNSRYSNTATVSTAVSNYGGGSPPYCRGIDYQDGPVLTSGDLVSQPFGVLQSNSTANWCAGTGAVGPSNDVLTLGDPYAPGTPNHAMQQSWFGTYRGGNITSVEYSIDPAGASWQATPILGQKQVGWSRLPSGVSMLGLFHDFDPLGLPVVRNLILNLPMHDDPLQKNFQTNTQDWITGANTPLYGSLHDFQVHLQDTLDSSGSLGPDDQAQCRYYGFVLLTDGDENQPARQPNHPLATTGPCNPYTSSNCQSFAPDYASGTYLEDMVDTIKNTNGGTVARTPRGVRSYMVSYGNGATSDLLDRMARRAGTAVNPLTGQLDLVTGQAYKPQTADDLRAAFQAIAMAFGNVRLSRSKPTIVRDASGSMVYTGSYQFDSSLGAREWYGYLDAYNTGALGAGSQAATWKFDQKLLTQSSASRHVYTWLPGVGSMVDLNASVTAAQKDELKTRMGYAVGAGTDGLFNDTLASVLNPTPSPGAPFLLSTQRRKTRLAAVIHSTPAVVGPPRGTSTWPGEASEETAYATFKAAHASRETRVINASNDGVVHAICEPTNGVAPSCNGAGGRGNEAWGFVPPAIHDRLDNLHVNMVNEYTSDGSFGGGDVCFANCAPASGYGGWFSILLGSMHKGSPSLFALDVTNPDVPAYKWTFTTGLMGESWSPPTLARVVVDMPPALGGPGQKRWVGLVGAGYKRGDYWGSVANGFLAVDLSTGGVLVDATTSGSCTNAYGVTKSPCNQAQYRVDHNAFSCDAQAPATAVSPACTRYRNSVPARVGVSYSNGALARAAYFGDVQGRVSVSRLETPKVADWQPQQLFDATDPACRNDIFSTPGGTPIFDAADTVMATRVDSLPLAEDDENGTYAGTREVRSIYQRVLAEQLPNGLTYVFAGTGTDSRANEDDTYDYLYAIEDSRATGSTCVGRPAWVKRFPLGEKVLSEMASQAGVLFVSTFLPQNNDPCSNVGDTVVYAFYQQTGRPALVFDNGAGGKTNRVTVAGTGLPADTTVVPTSDSTVDILIRTQDPDHRFEKRAATGLSQPGRIKSWRRVR